MCLDCAFGSCNGNTTECVCQPPYTQTREMFVFPPGFVCLEANIEACLPCDINGDAVVVLFVLGAVSSFLALVLLTYRLASFRRIQRNAMMYCGFIGIFLADCLRIADEKRGFGEDLSFTILINFGFLFSIIHVLSVFRRFLQYIRRTVLGLYNAKVTVQRVDLVMGTNRAMSVLIMGLGVMPVISAAGEELDKSTFIRIYFLLIAVVSAYVLVLNVVIYGRLLSDIKTITGTFAANEDAEKQKKFERAGRQLQQQRTATFVLFIPCILLFVVMFAVDQVYRFSLYLWPVFHVTSFILLGWLILKRGIRRTSAGGESARDEVTQHKDGEELTVSL